MDLRSKIAGIAHYKLMGGSILASFLTISIIVATSAMDEAFLYYEVLEGYSDKTAYENCIEEGKRKKIGYLRRPSLSLMDGYPEEEVQKCKQKFGMYKRVKNEKPFHDYIFLNSEMLLWLFTIITTGLYLITSVPVLYISSKNIGWKRLSIVIAFMPAIFSGLWAYKEFGYSIDVSEFVAILIAAVSSYIIGLYLMLGGKRIIHWIKEGFDISTTKKR